MITQKHAPRLLGIAFLFVALISLASGLLHDSVAGAGSISDILVNIASGATMMYVSILGQMVQSAGIVALASLLYIVLSRQDRVLALVGLGLWLGEATMLAISQIGVAALIPLSQAFVQAGAPSSSYYQGLGAFLNDGVYGLGMTMLMFFYCVGGLLFYYLFYASRYVPRAISVFGLVTVSLALVAVVLQLLGQDVSILLMMPLLPFELIIGAWLALRGVAERPAGESAGIGGPDASAAVSDAALMTAAGLRPDGG